MSAKEPYDFLDIKTPDYDYTLEISTQGDIAEEGQKNQILHRGDDNSREVISIPSSTMFFVSWSWTLLSESDSGTIFDLYHDPAKANGRARSFKWAGHDGHTYVVVFDCDLTRRGRFVTKWGMPGVRLEIIGRIAD